MNWDWNRRYGLDTGIWDWDWRSVLQVGIEDLGLGLWTGMEILIENGDWTW